MSMPEFPKPDPDLTQEQALTMILSSIALEEAALSHIINAEGEKIQYILKQAPRGDYSADIKDTLAVNESVANLLQIVLQNQMILKNKTDRVLEHLPKPPEPPCPPKPPCPPEPPCPPKPCQPFCRSCFEVIPKVYRGNEPLQWKEDKGLGCFKLVKGDCSKILLPRAGAFAVCIYMDICDIEDSGAEMKFTICCPNGASAVKIIHLNPSRNSSVLYGELTIQMPCSCLPCHASITLGDACGMHVREGRSVFSIA